MHLPAMVAHEARDLAGSWDTFTQTVQDAWDEATGQGQVQHKQADSDSDAVSLVEAVTTVTLSTSTTLKGVSATPKSSSVSTNSAAMPTSTEVTTTTSSAASTITDTNVKANSATTGLPSSVVVSTSQQLESTLAVAQSTGDVLATATTNDASVVAVTISASGTAAATVVSSPSGSISGNSDTSDTSSAVKAGIAIAVLAAVLVVFLCIYFMYSRRKKQLEQARRDDEKLNGPISTERPLSARTSATAPRLSLRPVTQFLPNLTPHPQRRQSLKADIALSPTSASAAAVNANKPLPSLSHWERPSTASSNDPRNPFSNDAAPTNPFGHNAEHVEDHEHSPASCPPSPTSARPTSPTRSISPVSSADSEIGVGVGVATTTDVAADVALSPRVSAISSGSGGLVRKASIRKDNAPQPLDLTRNITPMAPIPPSPAGTEFSMHSMAPGQIPGPSASAAAIAAAGGPPQTTVHRVQLDFRPTLDDELGLKAGQLVRLLHEYDDGWALCIRLDRSAQGVVPRTCLSTRPVKPRPSGPGPRGPGGRPMTPQGRPVGSPQGRPESPSRPITAPGCQSPAGFRPSSPGPPTQDGRPASPGGQRSQLPNGMSPRRMSPPSSSALNQEFRPSSPSPGQAY